MHGHAAWHCGGAAPHTAAFGVATIYTYNDDLYAHTRTSSCEAERRLHTQGCAVAMMRPQPSCAVRATARTSGPAR